MNAQTQQSYLQAWAFHSLLPWNSWHQQAQKNRKPQLKASYHKAIEQAHAKLLAEQSPPQLDEPQL